MKIHIISWNVRGLNDIDKRRVIKSLIHDWRADIYCFQETKMEGDYGEVVKHLFSNRWADYVGLEANGRSGGILIMWDKRVWAGELIHFGVSSISCKLCSTVDDCSWVLTGVYAPNCRKERKKELWLELAGTTGACDGAWVVWGF